MRNRNALASNMSPPKILRISRSTKCSKSIVCSKNCKKSSVRFSCRLRFLLRRLDATASNAWYSRPTVTICYEYLAEVQRDMPKETTPAGVTPADAVLGQFFYAIAHEVGHAMFDLLNVPVFGHQEDAADQFAGYIILQFGKDDARRLILGAAHSYNKYVKNPTVTAPLTAFSDEHGPPAQRYYNLLCLAYGADPVLFGDVVDKNYLPKERAKLCRSQYGELNYAFHQLISPHLDRQLAKQVMDKSWLPADDMPRAVRKLN